MDDTIFDMMTPYNQQKKHQKYPQKLPGFFASFEPIIDAVKSVNELRSEHDVWIATAPSVRNPNSYTDKRLLIEKTFDYDFCKKLIITPNKGLLKGDVLIDDYDHGRGQENFEGELIHFGSSDYPNWQSIMKYFNETISNI
jgi:5'(3')-deoxyribonucleotidase